MQKIAKNILIFAISISLALSELALFNPINKVYAAESEEWSFSYTGNVEEWTAPYTGKYYLDIYGAGAKTNNAIYNSGGHTQGYINLVAGQKLYLAVGQMGVLNGSATYNGGGQGGNGTTAGSGATSITTTNRGELYNFADYKSEIVLVAGGSGGQGSNDPGGNVGPGGGLAGVGISHSDEASSWGHNSAGGGQTGGFSFGKGQPYCTTAESAHGCGGYGGPGGGGYYGGTQSKCGTLPGGGGSGHINETYVYDGISNLSTHTGNGTAKIQYIGEVFTDLVIDLNGHGTYEGTSRKITINHKYGETIEIKTPVSNDGYKFIGWKVSYGSIKPETGSYTYDFHDSYIIAQWASPMSVTPEVDITAYNEKGGMNFAIEQQDTLEKVFTIQQSINGTDFYNVFQDTESKEANVYQTRFNYTGAYQTYKAPKDGLYKMEVYGSVSTQCNEEGTWWGLGGAGGSAEGYLYLNKNKNLYIAAGNHGSYSSGGWNGGGNGTPGTYYTDYKGRTKHSQGAAGGGATHIATELIGDGQLKNYSNNRNSVLIVAGGGGGTSGWGTGAIGGGLNGGNGAAYTCGTEGYIDLGQRGGSQTGGYAFGQGRNAARYHARECHGGGGGGWYGGAANPGAYNNYWCLQTGGSGGSGHIGNVLSGSMKNGVNSGDGYAIITLTQEYISGDAITNIYTPDTAAPDKPSNGEISANNDNIVITWKRPEDNGTDYWHKIQSYLKDENSLSGTGDLLNEEIVKANVLTGVKGYYYYIDNLSSGTVTKSNTFVNENSIEVPVATTDRYLHVAAVDKAGNLSGTYTIKIPSVAKYTVNHYAQNEDGTYTLVETEELMGTIGTTVTPEPIPQIGRDTPAKQSIVITADGKAVVNYYYDVTREDKAGHVSWNDNSNKYNTRPDDVIVRLYRDGVEIDSVVVSAADNSNIYVFKNMQKYDLVTGELIKYTVTQDTAYSQAALDNTEDKYFTEQSGFDFLNSIENTDADKPETPDPDKPDDKGFYVAGNIYWVDRDDKLGFRPSEVIITLYQKGEDGEWKQFNAPIKVNSKIENTYLFDWLPKYWYDSNGVPNAYEYKVEESFSAWYVKNGEMVDAYTIAPDTPNKFDFTNTLHIVNPDIPISEYNNTLIIKTNTDEEIRVILKPLKPIFDEYYNVSYGDYSGKDILTWADKTGSVVDKLSPTRYEIILEAPGYDLNNIEISLSQNVTLEHIGDKWYATIGNQPEDAFGTIIIDLSKKTNYYQEKTRMNNYFAAGNVLSKAEPMIIMESNFVAMPDEALNIVYMNSMTEDKEAYLSGDKVEILDYLGIIPEGKEFVGWSTEKDSDVATYIVGNIIEIESSLELYPVFIKNTAEPINNDVKNLEDKIIIE